jgi:hypothetical protein
MKQQYFDKKYLFIAISFYRNIFYRNIACKNCSDESLNENDAINDNKLSFESELIQNYHFVTEKQEKTFFFMCNSLSTLVKVKV